MSKETNEYKVKATVQLVVETEVTGRDHDEAKTHLKEKLIRDGFSQIKIEYITTTVIPKEDEEE